MGPLTSITMHIYKKCIAVINYCCVLPSLISLFNEEKTFWDFKWSGHLLYICFTKESPNMQADIGKAKVISWGFSTEFLGPFHMRVKGFLFIFMGYYAPQITDHWSIVLLPLEVGVHCVLCNSGYRSRPIGSYCFRPCNHSSNEVIPWYSLITASCIQVCFFSGNPQLASAIAPMSAWGSSV